MVVIYKTKKIVNTVVGRKVVYEQFPDGVWNKTLKEAEEMHRPEFLIKVEGKYFPLENMQDSKCGYCGYVKCRCEYINGILVGE